MDISKIKVRFGGKYEPKDERLIGLLKNAYQGKLLVHTVLIKFEGIKPFSDFKPQISMEYRNYFETIEKQGSPPPLYVYPVQDLFIMSDDYNAYFLYQEKGYQEIVCVLLGDSDSKFIIKKSRPFHLPVPKASPNIL